MRRLLGLPFSRKFLLDSEGIFKECVKKFMENIERTQEGESVEVTMEFRRFALNVVTEFAYGGYFKVNSIRPGISVVEIMAEAIGAAV